jgi:hypothetical protein
MRRSRLAGSLLIGGCVVIATLVLAGLAQRLAADPATPFLWPYSPSNWIIAPMRAELRAKQPQLTTLVFARDFDVTALPESARLRVRGFRALTVEVNGKHVLGTALGDDWKRARETDVAQDLHQGANTISVRVENVTGPPALWLALDLPDATLISDEQWRVTDARGEKAAALATRAPLRPVGAQLLAEQQQGVVHVARAITPDLLLFAALATLCAIVARSGASATTRSGEAPSDADRMPRFALLACVAAWAVLAAGATRMLLITTGFDADGHLDYVELVRTTHVLPLADRGLEMYHPPLYYVLQAAVLGLAGLGAYDGIGALLMRLVHLALGVVFLTSVAGSLRLLFPKAPRRQLFGLLFVAFLPVQLYIFQFFSNEVLAIALGAACFYACLRVVRSDEAGFRRELVLGVALGAALLAKQSALLLVPVMLAAVGWSAAARRDGGTRRALPAVTTVVVALLLTAGWHYVRVWERFGDPFVANWDGRAAPVWWQDPGFRTPYDLVHVIDAIRNPFFAASDGIVGGLYSSMWADSYAAGVVDVRLEPPPWRLSLVALGPLLGLPLTAALVLGWFVTARAAIAERDPAYALTAALVACATFSALWIGIAVPIGSITKATYSMIVAGPLAVTAAIGLDRIAGQRRWTSALVLAFVLGWAALSFATYSLAFVPAPAH